MIKIIHFTLSSQFLSFSNTSFFSAEKFSSHDTNLAYFFHSMGFPSSKKILNFLPDFVIKEANSIAIAAFHVSLIKVIGPLG